MPLDGFHPLISEWFSSHVGEPTDIQIQAWPAIQSGADLNGVGSVPGIGARSPSYNARQINDFKQGARHGDMAELMREFAGGKDRLQMRLAAGLAVVPFVGGLLSLLVAAALAAMASSPALAITGFGGQLAITEDTIGARQAALRLEQARLRLGAGTELTLRQAEAELASTRAVAATLRDTARRSETALALLTGATPRQIIDTSTPPGAIDGLALPAALPRVLPSELLARRPDVRAAEARLAAAGLDALRVPLPTGGSGADHRTAARQRLSAGFGVRGVSRPVSARDVRGTAEGGARGVPLLRRARRGE